ncbi:MAG: hypothetical protein FRX48_01086 [Lasallia pustulata]|uniref:Uncharacterized protein n=1 Tax=Lasallia pustulata TaxID=136370 RepID=A0A5M8Q2C7_9LECA|nr:MAG: hypothetical protein FRX48_01086 [Lasallia pustulata]
MSSLRGIQDPFRSNLPGSSGDKQTQKPPKAVFGDLATAHSSITSGSKSGVPKGPVTTKGDSKAAYGISQGNPTAMNQPLPSNRSTALVPDEEVPLIDENSIDGESAPFSKSTGDCYVNTSLGHRTIDREHFDTSATSRNDAVPEAVARNATRIRRSASVSDMWRHSADYPESMYPGYFDSPSGFDTDYDNPFHGFATPIPEDFNRTPPKSPSYGQYSSETHNLHVTAGLDRANLSEGLNEACDFVGNDPQSVLNSSSVENIVPGYSSEDTDGNLQDHGSHGQSAEYEAYEDMTHYEAEEDGDPLTDGFSSLDDAEYEAVEDMTRYEAEEDGGQLMDGVSSFKDAEYEAFEDMTRYEAEEDGDQLMDGVNSFEDAEYEAFEDMTRYEAEEDGDQPMDGVSNLEDAIDSDAPSWYGGNDVQGTSAAPTLQGTEPVLENQLVLSQSVWSPQPSDDGHALDGHSVDGHSIGGAETSPPLSSQATSPPSIPLPPAPPSRFQRQTTPVTGDDNSSASNSPGSYGHTRNLLGLSSPKLPDLHFRAYHASSHVFPDVFPEKGNMPAWAHPLESEREASSLKTSSQAFNQPDGLPSTTARETSSASFARVSILSSDGSIHPLSLPLHRTRTLEEEIASHLRRASDISTLSGHGSEFELPNERYTRHGRLSVDSDNVHGILEDLGPGGSQSSSIQSYLSGSGDYMPNVPRSGHIGRPEFYRDNLTSNIRDNSPDLMRGRARGRGTQNHRIKGSLSDADSAGTMSDTHMYDDAQADDDQDWETVAGSRGFSRHGTQNAIGKGQTGSSLADLSDSGSLSPPRVAPLFSHRVVQHPPHPRYAPRSFDLLRDKQSGELVLMPEYTFTDGAGFPNRNALAPVTANRAVNNSYQHPAPLSRDHAHPFNSSPPPMNSGRSVLGEHGSVLALRSNARNEPNLETRNSAHHIKEDNYQAHQLQDQAHQLQDSVKDSESSGMPIKDGQRNVTLSTPGYNGIDGSYGSSAWLSTQEEAASVDDSDLPGRAFRFAQMTVLGCTPNGTGAREVGSSLADGSSPGMELTSSSNRQNSTSPYAHHAPLNKESSSISKLTSSNPDAVHDSADLSDLDGSDISKILPVEVHPLEVQKHRENLVESDLLPREFLPSMSGNTTRMRSPHRRVPSHGEASGPNKLVSYNETAPLSQAMPTAQVGRLPKQRGKSGWFGWKKQRMDDGEAYPMQSLEAQPTARPHGLPIARVESPHLYGIPRPTTDAVLQRQKELSIMVLCLCFVVPPTLLIYGHGFMDEVMEWLTRGQINAFRAQEKKAALYLGYCGFCASIIAVVVAAISIAMK